MFSLSEFTGRWKQTKTTTNKTKTACTKWSMSSKCWNWTLLKRRRRLLGVGVGGLKGEMVAGVGEMYGWVCMHSTCSQWNWKHHGVGLGQSQGQDSSSPALQALTKWQSSSSWLATSKPVPPFLLCADGKQVLFCPFLKLWCTKCKL